MTVQRDDLLSVRTRSYLGRDFDSLRAMLLEYAKLYYSDRLRDFSDSSLGGLFLDFAAAVGDNLSFYLDHQFGELDPSTAVETLNIQRLLIAAGVPITGAAPALVPITLYVQVPANSSANSIGPSISAIPVIQQESIFTSDAGIDFILLEDVDFTATKADGSYTAQIMIGQKNPNGTPLTYVMVLSGLAVSGKYTTETIQIGATFVPFRTMTLSNSDVSEIVQVTDDLGNAYYEVDQLSNDVVYRNVLNTNSDNDIVPNVIKVIPAPYRYTTSVDLTTRSTTLTFGGGNADTLTNSIIPDPSEFAISFPYSKTFSRIPVNPQQLLQTSTLGVATTNTNLSVTYRYGGGLNHNSSVNSIKTIKSLNITFPANPAPNVAAFVKSNVQCNNQIPATGADDAPQTKDLTALIPATKNSQERIVTREDLLARVYTIPANFGRVFRAAIRSNPNNPLATQLFIISRDQNNKLVISPDALKQNLVKYLNPYRMISDAIDILDARIINFQFSFDVLIDPSLNRSIVLQNILTNLQTTFDVSNYYIDQPIVISNFTNQIAQSPGVVSINSVKFANITGLVSNNQYSDNTYDFDSNTQYGLILPPAGGIFECRYPQFDIIGKASV